MSPKTPKEVQRENARKFQEGMDAFQLTVQGMWSARDAGHQESFEFFKESAANWLKLLPVLLYKVDLKEDWRSQIVCEKCGKPNPLGLCATCSCSAGQSNK
jgi:hypothetical protein